MLLLNMRRTFTAQVEERQIGPRETHTWQFIRNKLVPSALPAEPGVVVVAKGRKAISDIMNRHWESVHVSKMIHVQEDPHCAFITAGSNENPHQGENMDVIFNSEKRVVQQPHFWYACRL